MPDQKALVSLVSAEHKQAVGKWFERWLGCVDKNFVGVQVSFETGWHDSALDFAGSYLGHRCLLVGRQWNCGANPRDLFLLADVLEVCCLQYMS